MASAPLRSRTAAHSTSFAGTIVRSSATVRQNRRAVGHRGRLSNPIAHATFAPRRPGRALGRRGRRHLVVPRRSAGPARHPGGRHVAGSRRPGRRGAGWRPRRTSRRSQVPCHFRDAARSKTCDRRTAGQRFHHRVGQVVFQRRNDKQIGCGVERCQPFGRRDQAGGHRLERQLCKERGICLPQDQNFQGKIGSALFQHLQGALQVGEALSLVRNFHSCKKQDPFIFLDPQRLPGLPPFRIPQRFEKIRVDGVGDCLDRPVL